MCFQPDSEEKCVYGMALENNLESVEMPNLECFRSNEEQIELTRKSAVKVKHNGTGPVAE